MPDVDPRIEAAAKALADDVFWENEIERAERVLAAADEAAPPMLITPQDKRWASYWREKAEELDALLREWEKATADLSWLNLEDLPTWLSALRQRLVVKRSAIAPPSDNRDSEPRP